MDSTPDPGQAALVGRIPIGRPLEIEGGAGAILEDQELILGDGAPMPGKKDRLVLAVGLRRSAVKVRDHCGTANGGVTKLGHR